MASEGSLADRQRHVRQAVLVAAKLRVGPSLEDVDILDLSAGGAKIAAPIEVDPDCPVSLLVEGVGAFDGKIAWRDGKSHGIRFVQDPETVEAVIPRIIEAGDARERRRHVRSSVLWKAEIFSGIRRGQCKVLNISKSGVRVRLDGEFKVSGDVTLRSIHFGEHKGRVVWHEKDRLGIEFLGSEED